MDMYDRFTLAQPEQLLATLQAYARAELLVLLDFFFAEAEHRLIQQGQLSNSSLSFETIGLLKHNKNTLCNRFVENIRFSADLPTTTRRIPLPHCEIDTELALLDLQLLDAQLALQSIIRRSSQRWSQRLYGIEQRFEHLLGRPIDSDTFSVGVIAVSRALYDGLIEAGVALLMRSYCL